VGEEGDIAMEDKILLAIRHALGILSIVFFIFIGLEGTVWQGAPEGYNVRFILFLFLATLMFTSFWIEKRKRRKGDMGLGEQWIEGNISKKLRKLLQIICYLTLGSLVAVGLVFRNQELSFIGGAILALMAILHFISVRHEREEKQMAQEQESNSNEAPPGPE